MKALIRRHWKSWGRPLATAVFVVGVLVGATSATINTFETHSLEEHQITVSAQRSAQITNLLKDVRDAQRSGHAILIQLDADEADISGFASQIRAELGAICKADHCTFVVTVRSALQAKHGR